MSMDNKVPEIRFKEFSGEWDKEILGDLVKLENGFAFQSKYFKNKPTEVIVLTPGSVNIGGGFQAGKGQYYDEKQEVSSKYVFKPGEMFITMTDLTPTAQALGFPAIIPKDENTYLHNQRLGKLVGFQGDLAFLYGLLCTTIKQKEVVSTSSGTTVKHTSPDKFLNRICLFPKKEEQTAIGNYFQKLDALINQHQQKHDKLSNIKKAMLGKMFPKQGETIPEIRFKGFSGEWDKKKLGEIGDTFTGLSGKTKDDFGHGQGRFVTYLNVFSNAISNENSIEPIEIDTNQNEVKKGDVFFTTSSETPEEVGMSSIWMSEIKNVYLNSFCFGYRPKQKFDNYYLAYMLRSNSFREKIVFLAQGISRYNISKTKVMDIKVSIPNLTEQEKIGNYFQKLDTLINKHQQQITKLNNIKQACLSKMFV